MIEIKLVSENKLEEFCQKAGVPNSNGLYIYAAMERGEPLGSCGFTFTGSEGELHFTRIEDPTLGMIEDGLLRSALSMMFERGVQSAVCKSGIRDVMLRRLGFQQQDGVYFLDLTKSFLTQGCGCAGSH